jgi:tetratricopeptide (TPR) repeat protein
MDDKKLNSSPRSSARVALVLVFTGSMLCNAQSPQVSPREQLTQYIADLQRTPNDDALREKIIKLALTLDPKPIAPAEVDELAGRGKYILDHASSDTDFAAAADAFAKASLLAPWIPDYYFDQASLLEKAKRYPDAVKNYELYLMAAPNAQDAKGVREKIGGLKYQIEQKQVADATQRQQQDAARERYDEQQREQQELQSLWSGIWRITGGETKDPRYRGDRSRHDSYHESHVTFTIVGNLITMTSCFDKPDSTYNHAEGYTFSKTGQVSGGTATFSGSDGEWARWQINSNGQIEVRDSSFPGKIPWIYSRVNDPRAVSPRCGQ